MPNICRLDRPGKHGRTRYWARSGQLSTKGKKAAKVSLKLNKRFEMTRYVRML